MAMFKKDGAKQGAKAEAEKEKDQARVRVDPRIEESKR